ncbi:MAG: hypothetical protein J7495_01680 [Sphingomonas sp.]|nr:hypothetical protein [Sphingomonas sp.]
MAALLLAGVGLPALGAAQQQDRPESLLPEGFGDTPTPAPAPAPAATRAPEQQTPAPGGETPAAPLPGDAAGGNASIGNESAAVDEDASTTDFSQYDLPEIARHSLARVGANSLGSPAFPARAFGHADGRFLSTLMRRLDAPVASRWASIALRRALMSPVNTPRNVNGADFAAERAWLLLRMGEPIAARGVVQDVDVENYTPKLYQMTMQVALANADPGGLCPIADPAAKALPFRAWPLARAMCAALAGQPKHASELFDAAQRGNDPNDIDYLVAGKVLGIGAQAQRSVTIQWQAVSQLTAWRWGLAIAAGEDVPESLYDTVGPQVRYWKALSPMVPAIQRVASAERAAAQGVFSNAGLVDLYSEIEESGESAASAEVAVARDLRTASSDGQQENRVKALQSLWGQAQDGRALYGRMVLTAYAAAGIAPSQASAAEADRILGSMLTAGYVNQAMGWRPYVQRGTDAWMLVAIADPSAGARVASGDFDAYRNNAGGRKAQLAFAGLAGLGKFDAASARSAASALDVAIGAQNNWTRAIDKAARDGDSGSVALLAAVGMQSQRWGQVTPEALFHIVTAFRAVGMDNYARLIAAEAVTRG